MDGPRRVAEVALELAEDRRHRERREGDVAVGVEPVDGLDQGERGHLNQVLGGLGAADVAPRQAARQRQEALDERFARGLVARMGAAEQTRDGAIIPLGVAQVASFALGVALYFLGEDRGHW